MEKIKELIPALAVMAVTSAILGGLAELTVEGSYFARFCWMFAGALTLINILLITIKAIASILSK